MKERTIRHAAHSGAADYPGAICQGLSETMFAAVGLGQFRLLNVQAAGFILVCFFLLYAAVANSLEARRLHQGCNYARLLAYVGYTSDKEWAS